jgi:hypothetical protein
MKIGKASGSGNGWNDWNLWNVWNELNPAKALEPTGPERGKSDFELLNPSTNSG